MLTALLLLTASSLAATPEVEACVAAQGAGTYQAWADYLEEFPGGSCAASPVAIDARDCTLARRADSEEAWRTYVSEHPGGLCIEHALDQLPVEAEVEEDVSPLEELEHAARAQVEEPDVLGGLAESAVAAVLQAARPALGRCHAEAARLNPTLTGRVEVRFSVGEDGEVSRARVRASTVEHGGVESCVVRALEDLRFAAPQGKAVVTVGVGLQEPTAE